jgi:hypothetical protein
LIGLGLLELAERLIVGVLVGSRIDLVEEISFVNEVTLFERDDGIVSRKLYASVPPKVEYSLTPLGASLSHKVEELCRWAEANMEQSARAQENFDNRSSADAE